MAANYIANAIVCDGTTTITGPVDIVNIKNDATTSYSITKPGSTPVIISGGAGTGTINRVDIRSARGLTVTVVGGGSVTLYLAVTSRR